MSEVYGEHESRARSNMVKLSRAARVEPGNVQGHGARPFAVGATAVHHGRVVYGEEAVVAREKFQKRVPYEAKRVPYVTADGRVALAFEATADAKEMARGRRAESEPEWGCKSVPTRHA